MSPGFKSLTPIFTVVCRPSEPPYMPDDYLPSVMTCVNYLKLPDYSSVDVLRQRLTVAMKEGQGAFSFHNLPAPLPPGFAPLVKYLFFMYVSLLLSVMSGQRDAALGG